MIRSGMIKKLAAGVYTYMPLGLRVIRKIENIIRDEMVRAGSIELLMPMVPQSRLFTTASRRARRISKKILEKLFQEP